MGNKEEFWTTQCKPYEKLAESPAEPEKGEHQWVYRGQSSGWGLETTLERHCKMSHYDLKYAPGMEIEMIRHFKRLYNGEDRKDVTEDTLYCISLMRHYGAPTRLLDFTYSKDVAIYFALECAYDNVPPKKDKPDYDADRTFAVWCIDTKALDARFKAKYPEAAEISQSRVHDAKRNDCSFKPLYMENKYDFVTTDNPLRLHQRLDIQHGVFLCPGNVSKSFMDNLRSLYDGKNKEWIYKFVCKLTPDNLREALEDFRDKTITRQSLLPGLDGFAQSMKYQIRFFKFLYKNRQEVGAYPEEKGLINQEHKES